MSNLGLEIGVWFPTDPSQYITDHSNDPDSIVIVGEEDPKDSVDLTLRVICIILETSLMGQ
jgi:hypothetical protein